LKKANTKYSNNINIIIYNLKLFGKLFTNIYLILNFNKYFLLNSILINNYNFINLINNKDLSKSIIF